VDRSLYDERPYAEHRLDRASPSLIWGALMTIALFAATATVWRSASDPAVNGRLVASDDIGDLRRDLRQLASERDRMVERLARVERGVGELKIAANASPSTEVTGSIGRPAGGTPSPVPPARTGGFGVALGADASVEAVRRRWGALAARHPDTLSRLTPRALRVGQGAGVFDLIAGPFQTRMEAERVCAALADQGLACDTTTYAGEPIARP
jgi:hypothetical protein